MYSTGNKTAVATDDPKGVQNYRQIRVCLENSNYCRNSHFSQGAPTTKMLQLSHGWSCTAQSRYSTGERGCIYLYTEIYAIQRQTGLLLKRTRNKDEVRLPMLLNTIMVPGCKHVAKKIRHAGRHCKGPQKMEFNPAASLSFMPA